MFDKIKFDTADLQIPLTSQNIEEHILPYDKRFQTASFQTQAVWKQINAANSAMNRPEFLLHGTIRSFNVPPLSPSALSSLNYLKSFSLFQMKAGSFTRRSNYDAYQIIYTYEGYGNFTYNEKVYHLGPGDGFFIDARNPHYYCAMDSGWTYSDTVIAGPLISNLYDEFSQNERYVFTESQADTFQTCLEKLLYIYSTGLPYRDYQASACITELLTHLLVQSISDSRYKASLPQNMQYLIRYIESNFTNPLTIDHLSRFSGISRSHLTREFKKYTGYAPNDYIIQLRLAKAKKLLTSTQLSVAEICNEVGMHNINNFFNLFKKYEHCTPKQYRSSH